MTTPNPSERSEIIESLKSREAELARRIEAVQHDRRRSHDPDSSERATERENDEVLDRLDEVERSELSAVRAALARVDAGKFGICEACEGEIDPRRLAADPSATTCIDCARRAG